MTKTKADIKLYRDNAGRVRWKTNKAGRLGSSQSYSDVKGAIRNVRLLKELTLVHPKDDLSIPLQGRQNNARLEFITWVTGGIGWRVISGNGEIVLSSERSYSSTKPAHRAYLETARKFAVLKTLELPSGRCRMIYNYRCASTYR